MKQRNIMFIICVAVALVILFAPIFPQHTLSVQLHGVDLGSNGLTGTAPSEIMVNGVVVHRFNNDPPDVALFNTTIGSELVDIRVHDVNVNDGVTPDVTIFLADIPVSSLFDVLRGTQNYQLFFTYDGIDWIQFMPA